MDDLVQARWSTLAGKARRDLRLGYFVPEFPSQTHAFFWREVQGLRADGLDVRLISTRRPKHGAPHSFAAAAISQTRYLFPPRWGAALGRLLSQPRRTLEALRYVFSLAEASPRERLRTIALIPSAADLVEFCRSEGISHVHVHSFANALHIAAIAKILGGSAYSATLHGDLSVYGTDHARKLERAAFASCVTRPLATQLATVSHGDVPVITMGVDIDRFRPVVLKTAVPDAAIRAVSVARLNRAKGHEYFLEAMARLVADGIDLRYTIAGEGSYRASIEEVVRRLNLGDRVTLLGAISEERVLALLGESDFLVLSSFGYGEAAPVAVMEAMACGLPVICSRIGGTADMIEDGKDGLLVAQQDVDGLERAARILATDPLERERLARAARQTACRKFDYRVTAAQLAGVIRTSLAAARS